MPKRKKSRTTSSVSIRGFTRAQLVDSKTGEILGDSGFVPNKIMITGFEQMLAARCAGNAGSYPRYLAIGNQTADIVSTNNSLNTVVGSLSAIGANTSTISTSDGAYLQLKATFVGTTHTPAGASISAIGMYNSTQTTSMLAGTTFASSTWSNDQDVRVTYELRFSQT